MSLVLLYAKVRFAQIHLSRLLFLLTGAFQCNYRYFLFWFTFWGKRNKLVFCESSFLKFIVSWLVRLLGIDSLKVSRIQWRILIFLVWLNDVFSLSTTHQITRLIVINKVKVQIAKVIINITSPTIKLNFCR